MALRGRPPKPEGQKFVQINLRIPPAAYVYLEAEAAASKMPTATLAKNILMSALATRIFGG